MYILSWVFGIAGIIINSVIYQQKKRETLLFAKLMSDIAWVIHYSLISAWNAALSCGISTIREIVFINKKYKWANSKVWLILFIVCGIIIAIFTWHGIISVLPTLASITSVFVYWMGNPRLTRLCQIPVSVGFLLYNIANNSYMGIVNECLTLLSIFVVFVNCVRVKCNISKC